MRIRAESTKQAENSGIRSRFFGKDDRINKTQTGFPKTKKRRSFPMSGMSEVTSLRILRVLKE